MGLGLFGGGNTTEKRDQSFRAQTSKNQGFREVSDANLSNVAADVQGRDVGDVTIELADQGAVQGGLKLAGKALDYGQEQSQAAIEAVREDAADEAQGDTERLVRIAAVAAVAVVGINAWMKRGRA